MSGHIKFAEPISKKSNIARSRSDTQEKGSAQRAPSPGTEIVYPTGWRLVLTTIGYGHIQLGLLGLLYRDG